MTQRNVERVLGRLLTDEGFRRLFQAAPDAALDRFVSGGWELTADERSALAAVDRESIAALARQMDPRIRKVSLSGEPEIPAPQDSNGKEQGR